MSSCSPTSAKRREIRTTGTDFFVSRQGGESPAPRRRSRPPEGTQPSQANIFPNSRVRNAQALRDERAYLKAKEDATLSVDEIRRLRRKALPGVPCLDCGKRMQCSVCDKEDLLNDLVEDYLNPALKFEKGIQADVTMELAADMAATSEEEVGPTQEEILNQLLMESQERETLLRERIKNKSAELDELQRAFDFQTIDLATRTEERDAFEREMLEERAWRQRLQEELIQLQKAKDDMQQDYEDKLAEKDREIRAIHAKREEQNARMESFLERKTKAADLDAVLVAFWWNLQQGNLTREYEAKLEEQRLYFTAKIEELEAKLEEERALYAALEKAAKEKQEELEAVISQHEATISRLTEELSTWKRDFAQLQEEKKHMQEQMSADIIKLESEVARLDVELTGEVKRREEREEEEMQIKLEKEELERQQQEVIEEVDPLSAEEAAKNRIKCLEEKLGRAEAEYNAVSAFLDLCQQKVLHLRRRLHAEVAYHLDSQAKFHMLTEEKKNLEIKLVAQRRCMHRQRIPRPEVRARAVGLKNSILNHQIDKLRQRLGAVKTLASRSPQRSLRWAIYKVAGDDDVVARRHKFLEKLNWDEPCKDFAPQKCRQTT